MLVRTHDPWLRSIFIVMDGPFWVGPGERVRLKVFSLKVSGRGRVWISQRGYH